MNLTIWDIDASAWDTSGNDGYWMGVGFGGKVMAGTDIIICGFTYTNNNQVDKFKCTDNKAIGRYYPPLDPIQNADDVNCSTSYYDVNGRTLGFFTARFERLLDT